MLSYLTRFMLSALGVTVLATSVAGESADQERPLVFGVNRVGDAAILGNPPDYLEHMYRRIEEVGGTCVRLEASTRKIEGLRGKRKWAILEDDLELALKYGQEPVVLITDVPAWASPTMEATHDRPYKDEFLPDYEDFCRELAERTKGKVKYFQICNEQNGCGWHCADGFNFADEYFPMLITGTRGLKAGNPDCIVSLGSLDDAEGHGHIFIERTYAEKAKQNFEGELYDAVSDHPYSDTPEIMRGKLDRLRKLLQDNDDGDVPFWLTEYAWSTRHMSHADQAAKLGPVLAAMIQPSWNDVELAIYLCIADFEMRTEGMGLCDANLRPKPAFYVFQGAERFGAFPPYQIDPHFVEKDRVVFRFKTLKPASTTVTLTPAEDADKPIVAKTKAGTSHEVTIGDLTPGKEYRYVIQTKAEKSGKTIRSAEYELHVPGEQFYNGNMEGKFFAGIADGWTIEGDAFCGNYESMKYSHIVEGKKAQAVSARGDKEMKDIKSTLTSIVGCEKGKPLNVSLQWTSRTSQMKVNVLARAALAPDNETGQDSDKLRWTEWSTPRRFWDEVKLNVTPDKSVARLFVQCRIEGDLENGQAIFALDDVRVVSP